MYKHKIPRWAKHITKHGEPGSFLPGKPVYSVLTCPTNMAGMYV